MPALYAHHRFGKLVLPGLPADVRGAIMRNRSLFDAGLQGPDFLFYYKPTGENPVNSLATSLHQQTGRDFFTAICRMLPQNPQEPELAYLYGLLAHYCLDSLCHPYIQSHFPEGTPGHSAMESEFERFLLLRDGCKRPHTYPRSRLMKVSKADSALICKFYPPATGSQIREAAAGMRHVTSLITCGNPIHRTAALQILRLFGKERKGLLVPPKSDPTQEARNQQLLELFRRAQIRYPVLLEQLRDHLSFREPLGPEFDPTFG